MDIEKKRKGNSKINDQIKKYLYNWVMHHSQVVQSPIVNDCMKVNIDGHTEPQLVPKLLLQLSFWDTEYGGLKEAIYAENNIIISDSTLRSLFPPQYKNVINI